MRALHEVVQSGKVRYLGGSSMYTWEFARLQYTARLNGWTEFISMQPFYNLLYREEERESKFQHPVSLPLYPRIACISHAHFSHLRVPHGVRG